MTNTILSVFFLCIYFFYFSFYKKKVIKEILEFEKIINAYRHKLVNLMDKRKIKIIFLYSADKDFPNELYEIIDYSGLKEIPFRGNPLCLQSEGNHCTLTDFIFVHFSFLNKFNMKIIFENDLKDVKN